MVWFLVAVALVAVLALVFRVNRRRFDRRLADEEGTLRTATPSAEPRGHPASLPPPVSRYHRLAVGDAPAVATLRMRHGGTFRTGPASKPVPIRGEQIFTADPPGFLWTGQVRIAPGVWIDARDFSMAGKGSMRVLLDDTVTIADARGPDVDQGSALRLLAEMPWYPTALFDERYVSWSAMDAEHARATLRIGHLEVSGVFQFGADGLPVRMTAERYMDKVGLRPWGGVYRSFRTVRGLRVPFEAEVTWQLESGPFTYAHWLVDSLAYDEDRPVEAL